MVMHEPVYVADEPAVRQVIEHHYISQPQRLDPLSRQQVVNYHRPALIPTSSLPPILPQPFLIAPTNTLQQQPLPPQQAVVNGGNRTGLLINYY